VFELLAAAKVLRGASSLMKAKHMIEAHALKGGFRAVIKCKAFLLLHDLQWVCSVSVCKTDYVRISACEHSKSGTRAPNTY